MLVFRLLICLFLPALVCAQTALPENPPPAAASAVAEVIASSDGTALKAAVGKSATVRGKVIRATAWDGGITFINLDGSFTAVCFKKNLANFPTPPDQLYAHKTIEVTGTIRLHKNKPEIEITKPEQVRIVEAPAVPAMAEKPAAPEQPNNLGK